MAKLSHIKRFIKKLLSCYIMNDILSRLEGVSVKYALRIGDERYPLQNAVLERDHTPVRGPTRRGNVYLEANEPYRIIGSIDSTHAELLSDTMLGPNTEFGGLQIEAVHQGISLLISGSLLSTVQSSGITQLRIAVIDIVRNDTDI